MRKNKFADYGKLSAGGDAFSFGLERYNNLLREAEENRLPTPRPSHSKKNPSALNAIRQFLTQLF